MNRYYLRDASNGWLINVKNRYDWVLTLEDATCYLSYGEAQVEAAELRKRGFAVSAISHAEALVAVARLEAA